ncbi:MAG: hypothetical protein MUO29_04300 [Desulfobacterales bacterium]|jgi:ribulose-5-phosphate 4-epimerase/fuculose-1-phosphate aldolase|nr:hypothetical protein [Desulfobacterales bacterium]
MKEKIAEIIQSSLQGRSLPLMKGYGIVVTGRDPEEACYNAFAQELNAEI